MSTRFHADAADERLQAVEECAARGGPVAEEVRDLGVLLGDGDKRVQRRAAEVLAGCRRSSALAASVVDEAMRDGDRRARWGAAYAQAVADCPGMDAMRVWVDYLGSSDRDLRWAAHDLVVRHAPALGQAAIDELRPALADLSSPERRKMALYCVRDAGGFAGSDELVAAALDADHADVRLAALAALTRSDVDRAAQVISGLVGGADRALQRAAAAALGRLASLDDGAVAVLRRAAASDDPALQRAARWSLQRHNIAEDP